MQNQAVQALVRWKEKKASDLIFALGQTFIDNKDTSGNVRHSKGRDSVGAYNYTLLVDDLIDAVMDGVQEGWQFDTIIVNPLAWPIFERDPILREQFFKGINGGSFYNGASGSGINAASFGVNSPYGKNVGPSTALGGENSSMSMIIPNYGGLGLNVILSPFAPFSLDVDTGKYVTDLLLIQKEHAGLIIIDEDLVTDDWTDPTRDVHRMKFRERYGFAIVNEGKAGRAIRNVVVESAHNFDDKIIWDAATGALPSDSPGLGAPLPSSSS